MSAHPYDTHADFYVDFVDRGLAAAGGDANMVGSALIACLGERLSGARVCDVCCGEGYVSRYLAAHGAREVVGIDLSTALIGVAKSRANAANLSYRLDDAHELASVADGTFDVVVSQLAMMDVADHKKMFAAVRRILAPGGAFVFSVLHPCFKARPFHVRDAPEYLLDESGAPIAVAVRRYASEGYFNSGGDGVRGHMGSYHRTLATYINDLIASGFALERLEEPLAGAAPGQAELFAEVPTVLVVAARAI